jgi:hypothetical protein
MSKLKVIAGALLLLVALVAPAHAGGVGLEGQHELTSAPETLTVSAAAVDTSTPTTAVRPIACGGNPTIYVAPRTATLASVTATIKVELYTGQAGALTWLGTAYSGTVTFGATSSGGSYFSTSAIVATSCRSATYADVKVTAIDVTGASVTLKRWVGGADANGTAE